MAVDFKTSKTKENLMRAFAGESQARNRYTFAAEFAKKHHMTVLQQVFLFTADQEKAHAKVFYEMMKEANGENVEIDGSYPVEVYEDVQQLLEAAAHNEFEEHSAVYPAFARIAEEEGFHGAAAAFRNIADIEKIHGERFSLFAKRVKDNVMFLVDGEAYWMCLNCGYIYKGSEVPERCPVCGEERGWFVDLNMAPYTMEQQ